MKCSECRGYGTAVVSREDIGAGFVDVAACHVCDGKGKLPDSVLQHHLEQYILIKSSPNVIEFPIERRLRHA